MGTRGTLAPYAAYLRIYDPLNAFPEQDRLRWASLADGSGLPRERVLAAEQTDARHRAAADPPVLAPREESQDAYVLMTETGPVFCPRQDRLRAWVALADFRVGLPDHMVEQFMPSPVVGPADRAYALWRSANPSTVPRILTSTWHVPARWFVIVDPSERELVLDDGERSCVFRTPMVQARRRAARTLRVLKRSMDDPDVVESVEELARWLEEFHPHAWVELDYGGLVDLLGADGLRDDTSAADMAEAVRALADGDEQAAVHAYGRLSDRWATVQAIEHAS